MRDWPRDVRAIYDDCMARIGAAGESAMHFGPAHIVWEDDNFETEHVQWCLDNFDEYADDLTEAQKQIVRESLRRLLEIPESARLPINSEE